MRMGDRQIGNAWMLDVLQNSPFAEDMLHLFALEQKRFLHDFQGKELPIAFVSHKPDTREASGSWRTFHVDAQQRHV